MKSNIEHLAAARAARTNAPRKRKEVIIQSIRTADGKTKSFRMTPAFAMKAMCSECMGWESDPAGCTDPLCPLFHYRKITLRTRRG